MSKEVFFRTSLPEYLPDKIKKYCKSISNIQFSFSNTEKIKIHKPKKIKPSAWSERYRVLVKSTFPGPWRNDVTPYLVGIMDAAAESCVDTIVVCKSPQVGLTEAMHNFCGWTIDIDPGDVMYVFPDDSLAKENIKDRILPMIQASSRLKKYLTGKQDDETVTRINLQHVTIYTGSARSPSQLSNKPIRYLFLDEVDKYPDVAGKRETDPISLAKKRTTTFSLSRKIWIVSTPTTEEAPVWKSLNTETQAVFHYWVQCPKCQKRQKMFFDQIKWPKDERNPEKIESEKLAKYECQFCHCLWDDFLRNRAVAGGKWMLDTGEELFSFLKKNRIKKIGFHLPAWISPFVSLSEIAAAFLRGQKDKVKLRDFMNNYKAEPWVDFTEDRKEKHILALRDDRPMGVVPDEADVLIAGIDTQDNGFYYEIRAWKFGTEMESWQVRFGFVENIQALDKVLFESEYKTVNGEQYPVKFGFIDSQGHKTAEVYDWCLRCKIIKPVRGEQRISGAPYKITKIDFYPGGKRRLVGGLLLYRLDTNYYKDILASKLEISLLDPGAYHLCSDATEEYAKQMCAEYIDAKTGKWVCPSHKQNHYWDCSVYGLAAADVFGVKHLTRKDKNEVKKGSVVDVRNKTSKPTWFYRR